MNITLNLLIVIITFVPLYFLGAFRFKAINFYAILFWFSFVFCVIGAFIISSGFMDDTFFIAPIANNIQAKQNGLFITCISFFLFFTFSWLTEVFYNLLKHGKLHCKVKWDKFSLSETYDSSIIVSFMLWSMSLLLVAYYLYTINPAPLLMALSGNSPEQIALRRLAVTKDYDGIGYFKTLALVMPSILSYYYFVKRLINPHKKIILNFLVLLSVLLSVFTLILNGEKSPLMFYFLGLLVVYSTIRPLKIVTLFMFGLSGVGVLFFMYIILFQFGDTNYMLYIIIERIFIAQEAAVFYSADYFANSQFLGFTSLDNIFTKLLGFTPQLRASELFMYKYVPEMVSNGGWNVNGYFPHETYANFGLFGVILGAVYGGVINAWLCIFLRTRNKSALNLSFYAFYSVSVTTILSSFNAMLFNTQLILVFAVYMLIKAYDKKKIYVH